MKSGCFSIFSLFKGFTSWAGIIIVPLTMCPADLTDFCRSLLNIRFFRFLLKLHLIPVLLFPLFVSGQLPYFRHIASVDDFGEGHIKCIYQDKQGFIWIGATSGAYRYDGQDYKALQIHDSILNRSVTAVYEDSLNTIWFGFEDGNILKYDRFNVTGIGKMDAIPTTRITAITLDQNHNLWFGTYGEGLFVYQNSRMIHLHSATGLSDDFIYTLSCDMDGNIWAGTDNGISICKLNDGIPDIRILSVAEGLPDFIVRSIKTDHEGNIWIGMHEKGIVSIDPQSNQFIIPGQNHKWKSGSVNDFAITSHNLWVATDGYGLIAFDPVKGVCQSIKPSGINLNRVNSMMTDMEGNIWLISNKEIFLSFGERLKYYYTLDKTEFKNIHAICCDHSDQLWFANDLGLYRFITGSPGDKNPLTCFPLSFILNNSKIMSLYPDHYGFVWIGTFGEGLIRFDPKSGKHIRFSEKDGISNGNVLSIKGTENEIWFATLGGAYQCKTDRRFASISYIPEFIHYGKAEGLSNNYIYNLHIDPSGSVWFATDGSGVCRYENGRFINIPDDSTFRDKVVYSVTGDSNGNIWMNIAKEGLYQYDGKYITRLYHDTEHRNLSFSGIIANENHELIISYNKGFDVLNTITGSIIHYEENAGMSEINPDPNVLTTDSKGNVWMGTELGIIRYSPMNKNYRDHPLICITDVYIYLEKTNHHLKNVFNHNQNHLSFNYSGLWYQYPEKVEYIVRLNGHDLDWIKTKNMSVIYSDLAPGNYTFEVKAALYGNFDDTVSASYTFTIKKPFWLRGWFFIILIFLAGMIIYLYIKMREKKIERKQELLRERIMFQFENLKSQINPHFLFNSFSTLIALIDQDKEAAIEYVEELSNLFRTALEYKDLDLISLSEELTIIDNYYQLQKKRYGNNLELKVKEIADLDKIKIPPLTLQLLIENAIKHNVVSREFPLQIRIFTDDQLGYLYVENNLQPKKEEVKSTGIGIRNIIERYNLITDRQVLISKSDMSFKVGLPFIY